jgi:ketosteroid isomerase-like protein
VSRENVELHRRFNEAFNAHDLEAFNAFFDPGAEFRSLFAAVGGAVYRGHADVPRYFRDLADAFGDEIRVEPEAYFDLGEKTLAFMVLHARGRHSAADVAMRGAQVIAWRAGLLVYWESYADRHDALRDLGVCEDELQPIAP